MSSASWHARINCGRDTGAGFLVTERHVLTCAHVVAHSDTAPVAVSFAHGGEGEVPARVIAHGGWDGRDTDPGDLAVLELDRPVSLKPAEFATPSDAYGDPPRRLLAYGFPKRYDEGTLAEYRATADQLIAGEWVQLEAWAAHGQPLAPGFSGAAVTLADTGRVVGMVSAAARSPEIRNGRMLPTQIMARYWPRLGDLIPTPEYDQPQKERLRRLVEAAEEGAPSGAGELCAQPPRTRSRHTTESPALRSAAPKGCTSTRSAPWAPHSPHTASAPCGQRPGTSSQKYRTRPPPPASQPASPTSWTTPGSVPHYEAGRSRRPTAPRHPRRHPRPSALAPRRTPGRRSSWRSPPAAPAPGTSWSRCPRTTTGTAGWSAPAASRWTAYARTRCNESTRPTTNWSQEPGS